MLLSPEPLAAVLGLHLGCSDPEFVDPKTGKRPLRPWLCVCIEFETVVLAFEFQNGREVWFHMLIFIFTCLTVVGLSSLQMTTWFLGLQDLLPRTMSYLSLGQFLWRRCALKLNALLLVDPKLDRDTILKQLINDARNDSPFGFWTSHCSKFVKSTPADDGIFTKLFSWK